MPKSNYISWSKKSNEASDIVKLLDLHSATNGLQGLSPDADAKTIRDYYESTPALQQYNPRYFFYQFQELGDGLQIE